jgi:small subunit ribosomal protein S8
MSQTDPIADLLTRIRNGVRARHDLVEVNHSKIREQIARVLEAEGFISGFETGGEAPKRKLVLKLRYSDQRQPVIRGIKRVSRPSIRVYAGAKSMPRVGGGMGMNVVSTPLGVMTDREARSKKVGGEVLLAVW